MIYGKLVGKRRKFKKRKSRSGKVLTDTKEKTLDSVAINTRYNGLFRSGDRLSTGYNQNPDKLVQRKGLAVFDYMLNDDQIAAYSGLKKIARLATNYEIFSASSSKKDQKIAAFVRHCLFENMEIPIRVLLYNLLTAVDYGFAIAEKVWKYNSSGKWKGTISYKTISPKSPKGFLFDRDEFGNLKKNGIVQNIYNNTFSSYYELRNKINILPHYPVKKFVLFSYNSRFRNPYGASDLRAAFRNWISKDMNLKFWNMYLERYGSPIPMGTIPPGADSDLTGDFQSALESLQVRSALTIPDGFDVKFLESERTATPGFEKSIGIHNGAMGRAQLVPDLMGLSGGFGTGGSYGLGKTQYDVFVMMLEYIGLQIEEVVFGKQIIKPLVDANFNNVEKYPTFRFSDVKRETRKDRAQILQILVESGLLQEVQEWMFPFVGLPLQHSQMPQTGVPIVPLRSRTPEKDRGNRRSETDERSIVDDNRPAANDED